MERTLDMRFIRYLNLFGKITGIRIHNCFSYNSTIFFVVPASSVSKAIGEDGRNVKKLNQILGKKVRVIKFPKGRENMQEFILSIIHPLKIKGLEISDDKAIINAGMQSKAALIGRGKCRLAEMQKIVEEYFGIKELKVS